MMKTMSFAAVHFTVAFTVAYLMTGSVVIGGAMAMVEPAVNTVAYYFHERIWAHRARVSPESVKPPHGASTVMIG